MVIFALPNDCLLYNIVRPIPKTSPEANDGAKALPGGKGIAGAESDI
jgi:hypothetical protein